jgi:hypothetical protein
MNWEFHMSSKGTIKRIVSDKGFGFVADESGQEYFFHQPRWTSENRQFIDRAKPAISGGRPRPMSSTS